LKRQKWRMYKPGPGALVTAAFIGPGTIATCSLAGARFGFALLWGLVFSVFATVVLQEMAARLGIVTQQGLGDALRKQFGKALPRLMASVLVISAIAIGNAAFEAGNILGASLGLESAGLALAAEVVGVSSTGSMRLGVLLIGAASFFILFSGSYKFIERVLVGLVIMMSLTFFTTAIVINPPVFAILKGMFIPALPDGSLVPLIGLIGTTVVPYNLFLYASAVLQRWKKPEDLPEARRDISVSVIVGGLISMAILVSAAMAFFGQGDLPVSGQDLARQLEPLMGSWSKYMIGAGLFAAGVSSAITAPLAAAWATTGMFGWNKDMHSWRFRMVWMVILVTGVVFAMLGFKPMEVIVFAQAANGILLPVIAVYLFWIMNSRKIMGAYTNGWMSNAMGAFVVLTTLILSLRTILSLLNVI
jgi:manganese transport protein